MSGTESAENPVSHWMVITPSRQRAITMRLSSLVQRLILPLLATFLRPAVEKGSFIFESFIVLVFQAEIHGSF